MKSKLVSLFLLSIYLVVMLFGIIEKNKYQDEYQEEFKSLIPISIDYDDFSMQWACFDGCFNMLEVEHGPIDFDDEDLEALHYRCCMMCDDQYPLDENLRFVPADIESTDIDPIYFNVLAPLELAPTYIAPMEPTV